MTVVVYQLTERKFSGGAGAQLICAPVVFAGEEDGNPKDEHSTGDTVRDECSMKLRVPGSQGQTT